MAKTRGKIANFPAVTCPPDKNLVICWPNLVVHSLSRLKCSVLPLKQSFFLFFSVYHLKPLVQTVEKEKRRYPKRRDTVTQENTPQGGMSGSTLESNFRVLGERPPSMTKVLDLRLRFSSRYHLEMEILRPAPHGPALWIWICVWAFFLFCSSIHHLQGMEISVELSPTNATCLPI